MVSSDSDKLNDLVCRPVELQAISDSRGTIFVLEGKNLPFKVKRLFITYHKAGTRGNHAHRKLKQIIVLIRGKIRVRLIGRNFDNEFILNTPSSAVFIPPMTWTELSDVERESVFLVLASEEFEMNDYIGKWTEFEKIIKKSTK
jgi:dTDP-4-dehydrorhamnose 3,5-epimerase-like enzyme